MIGHSSADHSTESGHVALLVGAAVAHLPVEGPSTASETDITPRQNDGRALIIRHTVRPWRAIILQALGLQGPNGLKTLEPRGAVRINYGFKERTSTCLAGSCRTAVPFRDDQADTLR
jgi:hypothetical protein